MSMPSLGTRHFTTLLPCCWLCVLFGLLLGLKFSAISAPNGLTQIPIAKVFSDGVASFSIARAVQTSQTTSYTAQYGVGNVLEFGIDDQAAPPEQKTFLGNLKYLIAHRPGRLPDVAVGMTNVATGQKAVPHAAATTQPRAIGFSLGVIRPNGSTYETMAVISYNVMPTVAVVGDYVGGRQNYGTFGVITSLTKTLILNVAHARPNDTGANLRGYVVDQSKLST